MIKIMFICHGNICRSPMAEFILKDMVAKKGIEDEFLISSSATSTEEIFGGVGNPVYPPAKNILAKNGISSEGKRAIRLQKSDYDKYDYLICMDENNLRNALRIIGNDSENKLSRLLDWTNRGGNVADPWYSRDFSTAYNDIYEGCKALLSSLEKEKISCKNK